MGMYTKMCVDLQLRQDTPDEVIKTLYRMTDLSFGWPNESFPGHKLFRTSRGPSVLLMRNCGPGFARFSYDKFFRVYTLQAMSELKNYDSDIESFFDWISPYVRRNYAGKTFLGYSLYEENEEPYLFYLENGE